MLIVAKYTTNNAKLAAIVFQSMLYGVNQSIDSFQTNIETIKDHFIVCRPMYNCTKKPISISG